MILLLSIFLTVSVFLNITLLWYVRKLLVQTWDILADREVASGELRHYSDHLSSIYEMEMFYGDETLQGLMDHTRHIGERLDIYADLFTELEGSKINDDDKAGTAESEAEEETTEARDG